MSKSTTWTQHDIDSARNAPLAPILAQRGYAVTNLPNGALLVRNFHGLLVHENRWSWKTEHLRGNTIDFFIILEGKTFTQAMQIVSNSQDDPSKQDL